MAVTELKKGNKLSRYVSCGASVEVPKMWFEGDDLVTSDGDRFPITSIFRYRYA